MNPWTKTDRWLVTITIGSDDADPPKFAALVGVFDDPCKAHTLAGLLASDIAIRTLWISRVTKTGRSCSELVYSGTRDNDEYWESPNGCWELVSAHEVRVATWHARERETYQAGVDWIAAQSQPSECAIGAGLNLPARTPASSAAFAGAGLSPVEPTEPDESLIARTWPESASNAPTEPTGS